MEFINQKALIFKDIRTYMFKINQNYDSSYKIENSSIRKQLFNQFYKSNYNDESQFISLFKNQISNKIVEQNIHDTLFESLRDKNLRIEIYNTYCEEIERLNQKCREQKLAVLRNNFIFPAGGNEHVQEILAKIDRTFSSIISKVICEFQNIIHHQFTELHIIRHPIKVDLGPRFSDSTKQILEAFYEKNSRPKNNEKIELSRQTELTVKQIETWFNNRRNREEKDQKELEVRTESFLREEMDWEERFNALESGKETSKDMIIITTTALGLPYEKEAIELSNNNADEATSSSRNSLVIRPRVTKGAHRSTTAPYTKHTPMITKITMMRTQVEAGTSSKNPIYEDSQKTTEFNIPQQQSDSENSTAVTSNKLKIRYRPNKSSARTKAQPYARIQNADKEKDNDDISNITPVSQEYLDLLRSSQSNVEPITIANPYDVIFASNTEYTQNLSDEFCSNWQTNTNGYETPSLSSSLSSSLTDFSQNQFDFSNSLMTTTTPLDDTIYLTPNMNSSMESLYDISFQSDLLNHNDNIYSTGWTTTDNFNYYPENDDSFIQYNSTFYSDEYEKLLENTDSSSLANQLEIRTNNDFFE